MAPEGSLPCVSYPFPRELVLLLHSRWLSGEWWPRARTTSETAFDGPTAVPEATESEHAGNGRVTSSELSGNWHDESLQLAQGRPSDSHMPGSVYKSVSAYSRTQAAAS